jgi:CRISPR/Cas system CSM-associated protein Csm3 (group 7 of RAMP superfamily)
VTMYGVKFEFNIRMARAWHVGTGWAQGLISRTINRDSRGSVYIPASTIKGRWRNACENLARLYKSEENQLQICNPPNPRSMCRGSVACITCRIFGSAYTGERLYFEDAGLLQGETIYDPSIQAQPRTRVKLDRKRGIAATGHLFTSEYAEADLTFHSKVIGRLPLTPPMATSVNRMK